MGLWDHMKPTARAPVPTSIEQAGGKLRVVWDDRVQTEATAHELRLGCPCAACVEEWSGRRLITAAQVSVDVSFTAVAPVGNYAVSLVFSDAHSTGIYSWKTLRGIGRVVGEAI